MRIALYLLAVLLVFGASVTKLRGTPARPGSGNHGGTGSVRPELEYLKAVNSVAPPRDPQLLFLRGAAFYRALDDFHQGGPKKGVSLRTILDANLAGSHFFS
jgi:hypothetical protein